MQKTIAIACDHGGFDLKEFLIDTSVNLDNIKFLDLGTFSMDSVDYPDLAHKLCSVILKETADFGILVCGTGIGMSMAANRHKGIRAALCTNPYTAAMSRAHNDANVLCLGGRVTGPNLAISTVKAFLSTNFEGNRHLRRIEKIEKT